MQLSHMLKNQKEKKTKQVLGIFLLSERYLGRCKKFYFFHPKELDALTRGFVPN
jgi:hypothetical protein